MTYKKDYTTTYVIKGHEYTVTAPALFDNKTNELLPDDKLDDAAAEIARQKYRDEFDLISPKDLKKYRAKIGLSQKNLAELTGLSPNTIALYEAGAFPTPANNKLLKSLISSDDVLKKYMLIDSNNYSKELVSRINTYFNPKNTQLSLEKKSPKFTALQLANWFRVENYFSRKIDKNIDAISQMKVIKLLYFAYERYLGTTHSRLFSSPIIHLQYGPVIEEVHQDAEYNGKSIIDIDKPSPRAFNDYNLVSADKDIVKVLSKVNDDYIGYSAAGMSKITHKLGSPWSLTSQGERIKDQLIFNAFKSGEEK